LLAVIKVAQLMVVQQALELLGLLNKDGFDSNSAYKSNNSSNLPYP
jgi:hypothetical protein